MDRDLYKRWKDHPLRHLLSRAAAGQHVYDDQLDDLNLPPRVRAATRQAIAQAQGLNHLEVDHLSSELVAALPTEHETRWEHEQRRAQEGDATALANIDARQTATARQIDEVYRAAGPHA